MFSGWKTIGGSMLAVAVLLFTHVPADAQPPEKEKKVGITRVAVLEAQLAILKKMTADIEEQLKEARAGEKKGEPDGFNPFGGFPGKKGFGGGFGKEGFKKKEGFGKGDFKGRFGEKKKADPEKTDRDIQERLDRLTKEIEEIRKSLKK